MTRRLLLLTLLLTGLIVPAWAQTLQTFEKSSLIVETATGPQHFDVELAIAPAQLEQGLMYRAQMAPDAGMLFEFEDTAPRTFWMKNTLIPLDMLFIASDGRIVDIHERAVPMSEALVPSAEPARAVLELNGGTCARLGIKIGDMVKHRFFGTGG